MKRLLRKYGTLVSILFLGIGALVGIYFFIYNQRSNRQLVETIRRNVHRELALAQQESERVKALLSKTRYPRLQTSEAPEATYPYFIFRNERLVYWSDYRVVPEYEQLVPISRVGLIHVKANVFLALKLAHQEEGHQTEIVTLIPLQQKYTVENDYLRTKLNPAIFPKAIAQMNAEQFPSGWDIKAPDGTYLFSVEIPTNKGDNLRNIFFLSVGAGALLVIGLGYLLSRWLRLLQRQSQEGWGILLLAGYLIGVRLLMLHLNLPNAIVETDLFNSKYYASSQINPSLGDLWLNTLAILCWIAYVLRYFFRSKWYHDSIQLPTAGQVALMLGVGLLSHWVCYLHFYVLRTFYLYSQLSLDITRGIDFSLFRTISLLIFVCNSVSYFIATQVLMRFFTRLCRNIRAGWSWFFVATLIFACITYIADVFYPAVTIIHALYGIGILLLGFTKYLYRFRYATASYFFTAALISAAIGAYAVYSFEKQKLIINKQRFGTQMLAENDVLGEFLLNEAAQDIRRDPFILSRFTGPFTSEEAIAEKVKQAHLGGYFSRYDVEVHAFDPAGNHLRSDDQPHSYFDFANTYRKKENGKEIYGTAYQDLYFINELRRNFIKQYVSLVDVRKEGQLLGYVVMDLKQKQVVPSNVYPELLINKRFIQAPESREYSYAIYQNGKLTYQEGEYNYRKNFTPQLLKQTAQLEKGLNSNDYHHVVVDGENNKKIVVSTQKYPLKNLLSNFSFLFVVLVLGISLGILVRTVWLRASRETVSFAARIQLYLNAAFFLPMLAVSIATLGIVRSAYQEDLNRSFLEKAENVSNSLSTYLNQFRNGSLSKEELVEAIKQIARYTQSDINVFDRSGVLLASSQPEIYEKGILSRYINMDAFIPIARHFDHRVLLPETVGALRYNAVYEGIYDYETNRLIGIVSIPFFASKSELDRQVVEVLSTILNIFTAIFITMLVLSHLASRILTVPLRLITQKIRKTSLHAYNEPIYWESKDEIGMMVGEYNKMLLNLEASKQALARSEKEAAWREMAQQVAHEIKNPLTPMKLTLQHLQRALRNESPDVAQKAERSFGTLLDQVDTLSDIATAFSAYAKMPVPKDEYFDVTEVLNKTVELYRNHDEVTLETSIPSYHCQVKGDAQLMSRIFTNLILNGIQSVPHGRQPVVTVTLQNLPGEVLITVQDNGSGIAENIRSKVFLPNFSTKYAGSGIGLAVAKSGIEHAGGSIWFDTEDGRGTTFFMKFPLIKNGKG